MTRVIDKYKCNYFDWHNFWTNATMKIRWNTCIFFMIEPSMYSLMQNPSNEKKVKKMNLASFLLLNRLNKISITWIKDSSMTKQ